MVKMYKIIFKKSYLTDIYEDRTETFDTLEEARRRLEHIKLEDLQLIMEECEYDTIEEVYDLIEIINDDKDYFSYIDEEVIVVRKIIKI